MYTELARYLTLHGPAIALAIVLLIINNNEKVLEKNPEKRRKSLNTAVVCFFIYSIWGVVQNMRK